VEAIALLLQEMGEQPAVCQSLVDCVRLNNEALKMEVGGKKVLWQGPGGHPAWYFGDSIDSEGKTVS
jgi:hypothetical protein